MKGAVVTNSGAPRPGPQTRFNREPIAVVGMACRFPGAPDLDSFWQVLDEGRNTVTEGVPGSGKERLGDLLDNPEHQNPACRFGAFVDGIEMFDAAFFRISPVEAQLLDPQQRMMLEVTWQALEDAGIDPDGLKGSLTGVYAGISNDEYRMMVLESTRPTEAAESLYALSGTNLNGAGGRVSFVLGLMGPAKAVDAACASSLVSVHDAVADLQMGKADLAIAGGVQAILNTRIYELRAEAMMLSPDGQCKAFDASANGYVRGEGCGVVVLKRLSEAEADGNRIWAVIRGAAINHGGTGVGLTVPNTPALEQVMAAALSDAEVRPSDIDYLEAHGTGTAVGDPIEINAVANVFGPNRLPDNPLLIGSVKTNIGHLESAAGIAGLIKAVLVVNRGVIPEHLHFRNPNPAIDWDSLPVQVTSTKMDWPDRTEKARLAGVNSFGISGTNAHLVVGEHRDPKVTQQRPMPPPPGSRSRILPLSAKSEDALRESANRYRSWLENRGREEYIEGTASQALLSDLAWTAGVGRSHFDHRAAIVFNDLASLVEGLDDLAEADRLSDPKAATKVAFAYTGQGSQWTGMGRDLYQGEPVAQAILDRCEAVFLEERGTSLLDVMFGHPGASGDLGDTAWEQPALYALECALTELWAEVGIRPAAVLGHSVGELAAAQAAGVFSLEDGMRFAVSRGELLSAIEPGAMAVVFASAGQVESEIEAGNAVLDSDDLGVAAYNGAHQVVSGPVAAVDRLVRHFESAGIRTRRLNTTRAFHSVLVEPALDALQTSLDDVSIRSPDLAYISNLTGRPLEPGRTLDGTYWRRHAREPVAFAAGVEALADLGIDLVIEIGPHAVLGPMAKMAWPESDSETPRALQVLSSLQRPPRNGSTPVRRFVDAVAEAYQAGLPVSFKGLFAGETRRRISIPGYPFQRRRHWLVPSRHRRSGNGHPGLGVRHQSAGGEITFETDLFPSDPTWLKDHRVFNRLVAPGALYGAMAASALRAEGSDSIVMEDFQLHNPLVFEGDDTDDRAGNGGCTVQVVLDDGEQSGSRRVRIFSRGATEEWIMHVEGRLPMEGALSDSGERIDLAGLKANLSPADLPAYYRAKSDSGIDLGPAFRTLEKIWSGPGEALGEVSLTQTAGRNEFEVPPLLLDGCFQVVGVARGMDGSPDEATYLPFGWERLWLAGPLPDRFYCHVRMNQAGGAGSGSDAQPEVLSGELRIYDSNGAPIGGLSNYTVKRATPAALLSAVEGVKDLLYEVVWRDCDLESGLQVADFFPTPAEVSAGSPLFPDYLSAAGVDPDGRNALLADLESWSRSYALHTLEKLGWCRRPGEVIDPDELLERLEVVTEHRRLFRRMLEMAAKSGILEESDEGFLVLLGPDDPRPADLPAHPEGYAERMAADYPQGLIEVGLFKRSGHALADVLRGQADPLTLLFSSGEPTAADLYLKAPVARAANAMLRDAIRKLLARLPEDRHLRVLEIGAGTGSATASVLPELPVGRFDYTYTDISAGFFAEAEERFGDGDGCIRYLPLDIEKNPIPQGFDPHGYDLLIASNVLHATRFLQETLGHCRDLLAPSGQLVALENLRGLGWMDLTFGQLDGWWRFADHYRPHHVLATPDVWRRALGDAGFEGVEVLGVDDSFSFEQLDKGVIVAQGPAKVAEPPGVWVLVGDQGGVAQELAAGLTARNQTVVMADRDGPDVNPQAEDHSAVIRTALDLECREAWFSLIEGLPGDIPFSGVVHLAALDGHGNGAATAEMMEDVSRAGASALALIQGLSESGAIPAQGVWFVTSGAQVLEREREGELSSAVLWGLGKVVALEASHLSPRMIDLEPGAASPVPNLLNELMYPDRENHIAYRSGRRKVARLVRADTVAGRIALPETSDWVLAPDSGGVFDRMQIKPLPARSLAPREIRVAVEAAGLNFWDVFRSLGFIEEGDLGREMCGYVTDIGSEVSKVSVGDHVVGLGFGAFAPKM
ncbi:MAG: beta-ketoacyl synthase N-terminal-like domain-containing protein, partial [bacterium]|nr:beta-ketoacyl synthase N-terminal-like domain-containing protein [bacterium]